MEKHLSSPTFFELWVLDSKEISKEKLNKRFEKYGYETCNFLLLSGKKITMFAAILLFYPLVRYMSKKFADKTCPMQALEVFGNQI